MGPIDRTDEFDATIYTAEYVIAGADEPIGEILERVEEAWMRSPNVVLVIPRGCKAFRDTHDFLALGKLPGARQVRVSVASPDLSITSLARVLGFYIADLPLDHPAMLDDPSLGMTVESDIEKPTSPLPLGTWESIVGGNNGDGSEWVVQQAVSVPIAVAKKNSLTTSTWLADPADYEAPGSIASPLATNKHPSLPLSDDRQTGRLVTVPVTDDDAPSDPISQASLNPEFRTPHAAFRTSTTPSGRIKVRSALAPDEPVSRKAPRGLKYGGGEARPFRWGRLVGLVSTLVVLAIVAGLFYAFAYLPEGTITLTPQTKNLQPLRIDISVLTSSSPQPGGVGLNSPVAESNALTVTLTSIPISKEIIEEGTKGASGTRQEARGRAQGTMSFVNTNEQAVSVPQGSQFRAANGVVVQVTRGGTVPATVFGQKFGELTLPIAAMVDGPDGNLKAGAATGEWKGLKYSSSSLEGGTLETFKVVTQEDVTTLETQLREQAQRRLYGVIVEQVPDAHKLITQTIALTDIAIEADHKAGEDAAEVKVKLTAKARAFAYSDRDLQEAVRQAVTDYVDRSEWHDAGPELVQSTVAFDPPALQSLVDGRILYATTATGRVSYNLTAQLGEAVRTLAKGKEIGQARLDITRQYGAYVKPADLQAKVLWFAVDRLPTNPARINVLPARGTP